MASTKEVFIKQTDLRERLEAVTKSDWFAQCLAYAAAALMETPNITTEHLAGANKFRNILLDLSDDGSMDDVPLPSSGLNHNLDIGERPPPKEPTETQTPKRRKKRS